MVSKATRIPDSASLVSAGAQRWRQTHELEAPRVIWPDHDHQARIPQSHVTGYNARLCIQEQTMPEINELRSRIADLGERAGALRGFL